MDKVKVVQKGNLHVLFDFYDEERENPVNMHFNRKLKREDTFETNGVQYMVLGVKMRAGVPVTTVRMVKYKIANTATQFVHKCPAKKGALEKMDRDDIIKIEEKTKKKLSSRVKMSSHNTLQIKCPHCKTIFWKERNELPEQVQVSKVMGKKRKKK